MSVAQVLDLWPHSALSGARKWIARNISDGAITTLAVEVNRPPGTPMRDAVALSLDFDEARVAAIPAMPPLKQARGRAVVAGGRLDVHLEAGRVDVPGAGAVALSKGRFSIPDLLTDDIGAELVLGVDGPARAVLTFLDHPPLGLIAPTGLRIDAMRGRTSGKVEMILPLSSDIKLSELDFRVKADIRDFSLVEPHTQARITGNRMTATASPAGLRLRSDARINGLSARVSYEQAFTRPPPGAPEGVLTLQSYLTEEDFALRAGVDVGDYFDGVAVLDATVDMYPGGLARFSADADLTGSVLRLPLLGWRKGDGVPLTAAIRGFRRPEGTALIETIDMRGAGMMAKGRIALAPDGAVEQASFERVVLSTLLDAGLHYRRGDAQRPRQVEIAGAVLDLRHAFAEAVRADEPARPAPPSRGGMPTQITARLAEITLRDDFAMTGMRGTLQLSGTRVDQGQVAGRLNGRAEAQLTAVRGALGLDLRLAAPDAGAFLDAASVLEGATGGRLLLTARLDDSRIPVKIGGVVRADGIVIRSTRTMRQILSSGAAGMLARRMMADGLAFTKVELPFSGVGGRWTITDGVAWGDALGVTLDGTHDIGDESIALRGTLSPAYAINGALGAVPLLGDLLTGGEGEGVFGLTFAVNGTTSRPSVQVNPLSALAPGFLRKIVTGVTNTRAATREPPEQRFIRNSGANR